MPRVNLMPPDTNEEEKAIGGLITFNQFFWLLGGFVLGIITYLIIIYSIKLQFIAIPMAIIVFLSSAPFAFFKKHDMPLFKYLSIKRKYNKKNKKLINRRKLN
ncbi:PrgI family protein [Clostridioides sp. ZZV14-6045]|uniref:PrgI family protein n=1 Tax=Clostridioides sp. ZZV14-6045 TaxID=2811489 RepID=UPI001D12484A|nr:PrgI family protein [Clostridioides sp. ZZV14-6045]